MHGCTWRPSASTPPSSRRRRRNSGCTPFFEKARTKLGVEPTGLPPIYPAEAAAAAQQARAQVDALKLQLSYTHVTAPHDGVVSHRNVVGGETVQAGQPLLSITDLRTVHVTANYKETQLKNTRVGDPTQFTVDAYPKRIFHGHVESLSPGTGAVFSLLPPENATGNFTKVVLRVPVRIAIDSGADGAHPLRLGMSVFATVTVPR